MIIEWKWERIDGFTERAMVPGGWLVKVSEDVTHLTEYNGMDSGWDWRIAIAFVPDPQHAWEPVLPVDTEGVVE